MKKVLAFVLVVVMVMSLAVPAAALASPGASAGDLVPGTSSGGGSGRPIYRLHTPEEVMSLGQEIQDLMAEAKAKLEEACPEGFAVKYFFYLEILVDDIDAVDVDLDPIEHNEIVFKQYVDKAWVELDFDVNEDGSIVLRNGVEAPLAIFTK